MAPNSPRATGTQPQTVASLLRLTTGDNSSHSKKHAPGALTSRFVCDRHAALPTPIATSRTPELTGACNRSKQYGGDAMKLLTNEIKKMLPGLYSTEHDSDPLAVVKFFTPWSNWTWYATEFDGDDTFFGLVEGHETELGYFSLSELSSVRGPGGLGIERDRYFVPTRLSQLRKEGA